MTMSPIIPPRRTALCWWALAGTAILTDLSGPTTCAAATIEPAQGHEAEHNGGDDMADSTTDIMDTTPRRGQRRGAHTADVLEAGGASRKGRGLKKKKKEKKKSSYETVADESRYVAVDANTLYPGHPHCNSHPEHAGCSVPAQLVVATASPTSSPTSTPTSTCESSSFTTSNEEYIGGTSEETKFSFTNELDFVFDCDYLENSAVIHSNATVESIMVSYQNNLLMQYGCEEDINYGAAAVTGMCVPHVPEEEPPKCTKLHDLCVLGKTDGCVKLEDIGVCSSARDRRLQDSSVNRANIRYQYNTMGNCRRRCADQSLPKENDALGSGGRKLGLVRRGAQETDEDNRDGLVSLLNDGGVPATGAEVKSDGKNNCDKGTDDCCGEEGKCCGVTPGCKCPKPISQTYCTATGCDLEECCGAYYPQMVNREAPPFVGCSWTKNVCLCKTSDCYPPQQCGGYGICVDPSNVCPEN